MVRITDLWPVEPEELINLDLSILAKCFLFAFSEYSSDPTSISDFITLQNECINDGKKCEKTDKALLKAFHWLCNEGLIEKLWVEGGLLKENISEEEKGLYFITNKGLRNLEYLEDEGKEDIYFHPVD